MKQVVLGMQFACMEIWLLWLRFKNPVGASQYLILTENKLIIHLRFFYCKKKNQYTIKIM